MYINEIELASYEGVPQGYTMLSTPTEEDIWKKIFSFVIKNHRKYLKHFIQSGWIATPEKPNYVPGCDSSLSIPIGKTTYIIQLYTEGS